jgi:RNA-directed DNA polymerase
MMETKSVPVTKRMVWEAYKRVRANNGAAGIDAITITKFEEKLADNLYVIWNRMSSGSYFPPSVKRVGIPKANGNIRELGIPTVSDRTAQMVVKQYVEPRFEQIFSKNSFGRLIQWVRRKFRVTSKYKAIAMLKRKQQLCPKLFAHWQAGFNV